MKTKNKIRIVNGTSVSTDCPTASRTLCVYACVCVAGGGGGGGGAFGSWQLESSFITSTISGRRSQTG